ncbi:MAG TPA: SprT family zinc-dependent metalloprotease [Bellilinea sp.]|nr:SprT family zinc-dependent metalloprotease [Bellilinea sp.]
MTSPLPEPRIIRSRRKTLTLVVNAQGELIVRAPLRMADHRIRAFIEEKADWILSNVAKMKSRVPAREPVHEGSQVWLYGEPHTLIVKGGLTPLTSKVILLRRSADLPRTAENWFREEARRNLTARTDAISRQTGLKATGLRITGARTRWGSCSGKNSLSFCWRIIMAPPAIIDYLVVHELAHTVHKNHSAAYWKLVGEIMPDYKLRRKWLKVNGHLLELDVPAKVGDFKTVR